MSKYFFLKAYVIIGFFYGCTTLNAQDRTLSDSLEIIYKNGEYTESEELKILRLLAEEETNTDKKLTYSLELILAAKNADSVSYEFAGYVHKGNVFQMKGDLIKALESYFVAAEIAKTNNLKEDLASTNIVIADVYSIMGNSDTAVNYYNIAIRDYMAIDSTSIYLGAAHLNLGDEYFKQKQLDSALYHFTKGGEICKFNNYELGEVYYLGNVGMVYAMEGKYKLAEINLQEAINVLTRIGDYPPICEYLITMADIYEAKNDNNKAINYASKSLRLALSHGLKEQISNAHLKLSAIYESEQNIEKSFAHYKNYIIYRDSINNIKNVQKLSNERTTYEISQKQIEVDLLSQQKKNQKIIVIATGVALAFFLFFAFSLFKKNKYISNTNKIIAMERQRSDDLLQNILPAETALELKKNGFVKAKKFESASVLFTDFQGFTKHSEQLSPEALVKSIDFYFSNFDTIIDKHSLEKIKTVGDAYMCAGGLPFPSIDHPTRISLAALDIIEFVNATNKNTTHTLAKFDIRVGINTGPVVAGVVGTKKFVYDIWGDTVNVASRMESSGEVGMVNISETTYDLLSKNKQFEFTSRGKIQVKGKGKVNMYFIEKRG